MQQPDMQLNSELIGDLKIAQDLIGSPETGEAERAEMLKALCAFHEERLNWRLQRVLEGHSFRRFLQQPRLARPPVSGCKPKGFG